MTPAEIKSGDRRKGLPLKDAKPNSVFKRILIAEIFVVATTTGLSLLLAYLILSPQKPAAPDGYRLAVYLVAIVALAALTTVFASVRVAHRICGPMSKIRTALDQISKGADPGPITIRRDDDLQDLVDSLNSAMLEIRRQRAEGLIAPPISAEILALVNAKLIEEAESEFGSSGLSG